jgi:DNA-binding transcriptional LysR family regulator
MTGTGPEIRDGGQLLQLVALGQVIVVLPESARFGLRSDLVAVPVVDGPISSIVVGWPERSSSRAVAAFVRAATSVAEKEIRPDAEWASSARAPLSGSPRPGV